MDIHFNFDMTGSVFLRSDDIELRTIEEEDIEWMRENINDPDIRRYTTMRYPINYEQEKEWFEKRVSGEGGPVHLLITEDGDRKGVISLMKINKEGGNAEIGLWISSEEQGKGYGTRASKVMIEYGFRELRLHRVYARVYEHNTSSKKIWKKLGFKEEGVLREGDFIDGEYEDIFMYGLLRDEWEER